MVLLPLKKRKKKKDKGLLAVVEPMRTIYLIRRKRQRTLIKQPRAKRSTESRRWLQGRGLNQRAHEEGRRTILTSAWLHREMCHQCTMELSSSVGSCREWRDAGSNGFLQKQFVAQQMAQIQKSPSPLLTLQSSKTSQLGFYWHFRRCIPLITLAGRAEPVGTEQLKGRSVWKHVRPLILIGTDGLLSCWGKKKKKKKPKDCGHF